MKRLANLTAEEAGEIRMLFEKKMAMDNLVRILDADEESGMYERASREQEETDQAYHLWWQAIYKKYQWEEVPVDENHEIYMDFEENAVCWH